MTYLIQQTLTYSIPLMIVALAGVFSERSGIINLALEGCMIIGAFAASLIVVNYKPDKDKDIIIILGCGIRKDGTPTPILRGRIDRALKFYEEQKKETLSRKVEEAKAFLESVKEKKK